ncbi:MAG: hypothetical protein ACO3GK_01280 [Bacteroidia bacterium]
MTETLRAIVLGSAKKAHIYQHLLEQMPEYTLVGFFDPDDASNVDMLGGLMHSFELANKADVFFIDRHVKHVQSEWLGHFIKMGKSLFIDGFRPWGLDELEQLENWRAEAQGTLQFGHVLFNKPLFTSALQYIRKPRFLRLEKHCGAPKPGQFSAWLFEQLAQEFDLIQRSIGSNIRQVMARPLFLFGDNPDLLNIHLEFDNDAVAHISLGRAIEPGTHKLRIFQADRLYHLDFSRQEIAEFRPSNPENQPQLDLDGQWDPSDSQIAEFSEIPRHIMPFDSWKMELRNFHENCRLGLSPNTQLEQLIASRKLCDWISERVQRKYHEV